MNEFQKLVAMRCIARGGQATIVPERSATLIGKICRFFRLCGVKQKGGRV
jgi:hypothetical protein